MKVSILRRGWFALAALGLGAVAACEPPKAPAPVTTESSASLSAPREKLSPPTLEQRARELAERFIIVDGHVDLPYRLELGRNAAGALSEDVTNRTVKGDFDWVRARSGGLDAPFMSIYVPSSYQKTGGAKAFADRLIDLVESLAASAPEKFVVARSVADVHKAFTDKKVALPLGIENGAALEGSLENLRHFAARGVRYITLTHAEDNDICDSSYAETHTHAGLSAFGREVVAEMNRLGVMVDVSHISDDAFWQVMDVTKAPVIASHSSCRHFTPGFERNMSDAMITRLAAQDGVIMINYGSTFLSKEARDWSNTVEPLRKAYMAEQGITEWHDPKLRAWLDAYRAANPFPHARIEDVADHILHVIARVGVDHVGLGSDFDGVGDTLPVGLGDPSGLPALLAELLRRGVSEPDVAKIVGLNALRVWAAVEAHAQSKP